MAKQSLGREINKILIEFFPELPSYKYLAERLAEINPEWKDAKQSSLATYRTDGSGLLREIRPADLARWQKLFCESEPAYDWDAFRPAPPIEYDWAAFGQPVSDQAPVSEPESEANLIDYSLLEGKPVMLALPAPDPSQAEQAKAMRAEGKSYRAIAKALHMSVSTAHQLAHAG